MAEVYGNLVIVVILVMESVDRLITRTPTMPQRHVLYDSRRVHWASLDVAMMLTSGDVTGSVYGSLMRIQIGWAYRYQYRGSVQLSDI